jgi:hypothetical protein
MQGKSKCQSEPEQGSQVTFQRANYVSIGRASTFPEQFVDAPWAGPGGYKPEKDETENGCFFAPVANGPKSTRRPAAKVCNGHLSGENECRGTSEQANDDEESPDDFQGTGNAQQGGEVNPDHPAMREAPEFFGSVLKK